MTITSIGYAGSVTDADWRKLASKGVGLTYGVDAYSDWRVSAGVGDRMSSVAPGMAFGLGVVDTSDAPITIQHATVPSGSRWDLIVARRNWDTEATTVAIVQGSATKALPARATGLGTINEQPLALARVEAGKTAVQEYVDLRCAVGDGGMIAWDALALQYLTRLGTSVRIGPDVWDRVTDIGGSPTWVSSSQTDTGWVAVPFGVGWSAVLGYPLVARRIGSVTTVRGAAKVGTESLLASMAIIPASMRPTADVPLGATVLSNKVIGELFVQPNGTIWMSPDYRIAGSVPTGTAVMMHGSWMNG